MLCIQKNVLSNIQPMNGKKKLKTKNSSDQCDDCEAKIHASSLKMALLRIWV